MRKQNEILRPGLITREIHSQRFISGLETALETTIKTGRETRFQVHKQLRGPRINYPDEIGIGTKTSSWPVGSHEEITMSVLERQEGIKIGSTKYPKVPNEFSRFFNPLQEPNYIFLDLHTHPSGRIFPSLTRISRRKYKSDIPCLNDLRYQCTRKHNIFVNPIMIIVGGKDEEEVPLLLMQENIQNPIHIRDFFPAKNYIDWYLQGKLKLKKTPGKCLHNLALATYDRTRKEVTFERPEEIEQFEYKSAA
ncbi:MAG: hypothetical protein ABIH37_01595 [archaeon]